MRGARRLVRSKFYYRVSGRVKWRAFVRKCNRVPPSSEIRTHLVISTEQKASGEILIGRDLSTRLEMTPG